MGNSSIQREGLIVEVSYNIGKQWLNRSRGKNENRNIS
jgi:hypothetical protein